MKEKRSSRRKKIMVTAGPTLEPIDPVRFISNRSSGHMGYKLAREAKRAGFDVVLISGPVAMKEPAGVKTVKVTTAAEMKKEVLERIDGVDCLVMAAAVCDFRPARVRNRKIKKKGRIALDLVKNPDILAGAGKRQGLIKIGFALETDNAVRNGMGKLKAKALDMVIVNTAGGGRDPFGDVEQEYAVIYPGGRIEKTPRITKERMARSIIKKIKEISS